MRPSMRFVALGGGQEVGASCYFLQIEDTHILLDCGKTPIGSYSPDFSTILKPPFLESLNQIDQIFISHSHYDHIGELKYLRTECCNVPVYATPITKALIFHMLWNNNKGKYLSSEEREQQEILEDVTIQSIIETDYYRKIPFSNYSVVMYEAGHIPGAAMIHLDIKGRSILYTGDFSCQSSALTSAYILPDDIYFDTIILCGLHAKHPNRHYKSIQSQMECIKQKLDAGIPVHLEVSQLTKGWEVLQTINNKMEQKELPLVPVYIDRQLAYLAEKMEQLHIPVRKQWNYIAVPSSRERCIFIGRYCPTSFVSIKVDFSLHPSYDNLISFIEKYAPKTVVLVHTGPADDGVDDNCMEREILGKASCPSNLIYAETGEIYTI